MGASPSSLGYESESGSESDAPQSARARGAGPDSAQEGTDTICEKWFWGHADSRAEPPDALPEMKLAAATLALKPALWLSGDQNGPFYTDFMKYVLCPHFLDKQAQGKPRGQGCPFLGGTAYVRHEDVSRLLAEVPASHASGAIERRNELGYLLLSPASFPSGTLGLGNSVEDHRVQRQWLEHLLAPGRLPDRAGWELEAKAFLAEKRPGRRFRVRKEVAIWWQRMLWKHVLGDELSPEEAASFIKFQSHWLQTALSSKAAELADKQRALVPKKVPSLSEIHKAQASYKERIKARLPSGVTAEHRDLVAHGVLEMFVFAGGLSVPQTMHCAVAVLFTRGLMPSPVSINEANVEAFVFEVTRLFPAVQGFCFWRDGERQILSLNAALRDPAVWGQDEANRFTLKPLDLYRHNHVGFADPATSQPGTFDSKACPGFRLSLDAVSGFVLAVTAWQPHDCRARHVYLSPTKAPKPCGVEGKWFKEFVLEVQDWLDGDQTGEQLLRGLGTVDLARLLQEIGMGNADDGFLGSLLGKLGPGKDREASACMAACDASSRVFYELSRKRFKALSERTNATEPDETPKGLAGRYFDLDFGGRSPTIRLPIGDTLKKRIRDSVASVVGDLVNKAASSDQIDESLKVREHIQRCAAIVLCQQAFYREGGEAPPPHSAARPDSYLPKAKTPFFDITTDESQVAIARCGMGQLFLRTNDSPKLEGCGDIVCDCSAISAFQVRPGFERLGAAAAFRREAGSWKLTAIDWRHADAVVRPGDADWEHAKFVWRCSMITHMTAIDHLVWTHWIVANALASSCREAMSPTHPVRRLVQAITYNTFSINHNSAVSLFPETGMLHRMACFPYDQLQAVFVHGAEAWRYKTWPQRYEECKLPNEVKSRLPMFEDGLLVWEAMREFMSGYVSVYYPDDESVPGDRELHEYWQFKCVPQYARQLPPLSKSALVDQMTAGAFDVTAYHELVGDVVAYTTDPAGAALQVRPGLNMADLQEFLQVNSLVAGTGTPMPMFIPSGEPGDEDWLPQLDTGTDAGKFAQVSALYKSLMARLRQISAEVGQRNRPGGGREMPFGQMDPLTFERSVSL